MMQTSPLTPLKEWFISSKRHFPWRQKVSPYAVLVSEVMLQQTQADRVIHYFQRWMQRFPTVFDLAIASEEEVMKLWEGLGYYSRARSLMKAARYIVEEHGGIVPDTEEALLAIPGIGPYTAGAILSFAYQKKAAAVDANVLRVLSRLFAYQKNVDEASARTELSGKLLQILPSEDPHVTMEALIELGALVCKKKPVCTICPLQESCSAYEQDVVEQFPKKRPPPQRVNLFRCVVVQEWDSKWYVVKRPPGEIMEGLYEFPYLELQKEPSVDELAQIVHGGFTAHRIIAFLPQVQHSFTRFAARLFPVHIRLNTPPIEGSGEWKSIEELFSLPFSSGHRKILLRLGIGQF